MAKYSFEFKKKIVTEYLTGNVGYKYLANKYGIPAKSNIENWINNYQSYGDKGLLRSRKNANYSFEYKLHVVELYLSSEVSYQELALSLKINNPTLLNKWVNDFQIAGPDALRPKKKGRKRSLGLSDKKINIPSSSESTPVDVSDEHVSNFCRIHLRIQCV